MILTTSDSSVVSESGGRRGVCDLIDSIMVPESPPADIPSCIVYSYCTGSGSSSAPRGGGVNGGWVVGWTVELKLNRKRRKKKDSNVSVLVFCGP